MKPTYEDVVVFGSADWGTFWYQTHQVALALSRTGRRVFFFNRTLQKWPNFHHLLQRVDKSRPAAPPPGIHVVTAWWLPPHRFLRPLNKILIRRTLKGLGIRAPLVITYCPSYNILDALELLKPSFTAYVNVHNYDKDEVLPDLLASEKLLARGADLLLADSLFHRQRLGSLSGGRPVGASLPGVDFADFRPLARRAPKKSYSKLYYFGGIGPFLDFDIYNTLAEKTSVTFLGKVDPIVRSLISPKIRILPPVPHTQLARSLQGAEVLTYFRKNAEFSRGVLPAKFFECMTTGLPFLYCGLEEMRPYGKLVYDVEGSPEKALRVLQNLPRAEKTQIRKARIREGEKADWKNRMADFMTHLPQEKPVRRAKR